MLARHTLSGMPAAALASARSFFKRRMYRNIVSSMAVAKRDTETEIPALAPGESSRLGEMGAKGWSVGSGGEFVDGGFDVGRVNEDELAFVVLGVEVKFPLGPTVLDMLVDVAAFEVGVGIVEVPLPDGVASAPSPFLFPVPPLPLPPLAALQALSILSCDFFALFASHVLFTQVSAFFSRSPLEQWHAKSVSEAQPSVVNVLM